MQVFADKKIYKQFSYLLSFKISYHGSLIKGIKVLSRPRGTLSAFVHHALPEDYIQDQLYYHTDIIIIQRDRDIKKNKLTSIRGIALLKILTSTNSLTNNLNNPNYPQTHYPPPPLELLILGNAKSSTITTRYSKNIHRGRGSHMIAFIKSLQTAIQLYSIDNTIPYYYQYGWRFYNHPKQKKERSHYKQAVHNLQEALKQKDEEQIHKTLQPFTKFTHWIEELLSDDSLEEAREQAINNGFRMILRV
jgi:hypothetical protein